MVRKMIFREIIEIDTKPDLLIDITDKVSSIIENCEIKEGLCHIFIPGTTAAILLNEDDELLKTDFKKLFDELIPKNKLYAHPDNAHSHLRASFFGQEKTIPIADGNLLLGTWQTIFLWEFDTRPRKRKLIITVVG